MPPRKTLEDVYRIFDAIEPDEYGCHNYPTRNGAAEYYLRVKIEGQYHKVHRLALVRKLGRHIKPGYIALHLCDCKSCVNPKHLREGTQKDNIKNMSLSNPDTFAHMRDPNSPWRLRLKSKVGIKKIMWLKRQRLVEERRNRK